MFAFSGREYECIEIPPTHIYILNVVSNKLKLYSWETEITLECELFIDDWVKSIKSQQSLSDEQYSIDDTLPWILDDKVPRIRIPHLLPSIT